MKTKPNPSIAILYIATGRYIVFWEHFYQSAEKYLLKDSKKQYFVFTDCENIFGEGAANITKIHQKKLGWPYDTLMRFNIFLGAKDQISEYDYTYFFNGNTEIVAPIHCDEFLPEGVHNFVFVHQPHMFHLPRKKFTYENNPRSTACINHKKGKYYITGALNGGRTKAYLSMCQTLSDQIHQDLANDIIAVWHDESHLNQFIIDRDDVKILPPLFTRGETEHWKHNAKIVFSDKTHYRFGGHAYLRGETDKKISKQDWEMNHGNRKSKLSFRIKQYIKSCFLR